jgi:HK97 family phage prohead protease
MVPLHLKHAQPDGIEEPLDIPIEIKEVTADGTFTGYGAVIGNVDSDRDVIEPGAFAKTLKKKKPSKIKLLWQHDPTQPIGVWQAMEEDKRGLKVQGQLLIGQGVPKADEAYALLKAGALDAMSIGFAIPPGGAEWDSAKGVRTISEVDLWEISLVTFPANHRARITRVKAAVPFQDLPLADRGRAWDSTAAEGRLRQQAGGGTSLTDMDWGQYRKAFLWYDSDNPEAVTSYKLPIADVVNGTLTAVPRAIFAAAGALLGARGGVDLPTGARDRVISHLERYYSKLDMESPFKAIDMEDTVKSYGAALLAACDGPVSFKQALTDLGLTKKQAEEASALICPRTEHEESQIAETLQKATAELSQLNMRTD